MPDGRLGTLVLCAKEHDEIPVESPNYVAASRLHVMYRKNCRLSTNNWVHFTIGTKLRDSFYEM